MLYIQQDSKIRFSSRSSVSCCEGHLLAVSQIYHFEKCLWPINMRKMNFDSGKLSEQFLFFCFPSFPSQTKLFECVRNSQKKGTHCTVFWWAIYFVQCNIFFLHKPFTAFEVIWHQDSLEIGDFIYKLYKKVTTNVTFILFNALSSFYDWRKSK